MPLAPDLVGHEIPQWLANSTTWPNAASLAEHRVETSEEQKAHCVSWLSRMLKGDCLPADVGHHLLAMKEWGDREDGSGVSKRSDVFIVRYSLGDLNVQIQESPYDVIVTFHKPGTVTERTDDQQLAYMDALLQKCLKPSLLSKSKDLSRRYRKGALLCGAWLTQDEWDTTGWKIDEIRSFTKGNTVIVVGRKVSRGSAVFGPQNRGRFAVETQAEHGQNAPRQAKVTRPDNAGREPLLEAESNANRLFIEKVHSQKGEFARPEDRRMAVNRFADEYLSTRKGASPETANAIGREGVEIAVGLAHLASGEPDIETRRTMLGKMSEIRAVASASESDRTVAQSDRLKVDRLIKQMSGETGIEGAVPDPQSELSDMSVAALLYAAARVEQGNLPLQTRQTITKALANSENPALFKFFADMVQRAEDEKLTRFAVRGLERILDKSQGNEQTPTR